MGDIKMKIYDKIQKLMNHAKSAETIGNDKEAQAFMLKIQNLCDKYKLEMAEVESFDPENSDDTIEEEYTDVSDNGIKRSQKRIKWQQQLASTIARNNNCKILVIQGSNNIIFVGRKRDRQIAIYVWMAVVRSIAKYANREYDRQYDKFYARGEQYVMKGWKASFFEGFVNGVNNQYAVIRSKFKHEVGEQKYGLVVVKPLQVVVDWMNNQSYGRCGGLTGNSNFNALGHESGTSQGKSVNLSGNGLGGGSQSSVKQLGK